MTQRVQILAALLLLLALTGVSGRAVAAPLRQGAVVRQTYHAPGNIPVETFSDPAAEQKAPALILAHGYNFSKINMDPIAETVARAGYLAVTFDFAGHGENPNDLDAADPYPQTTADLEHVIQFTRQALHRDQIALLGHSMGANTVLTYAMQHDEFVATIGVSGNVTELSASAPRNLLLFVGTTEDESVVEDYRNAAQSAQTPALLPHQFVEGSARLGVMIPDVTHTTILYAPQTGGVVVDWLNAAWRGATLRTEGSAGATCWLSLVAGGVKLLSVCA